MGKSNSKGNYDNLDENEKLTSVSTKSRPYDTVFVFLHGDDSKKWLPPKDQRDMFFEYHKKLDAKDIENLKNRFPQHGADFSSRNITQDEYFSVETSNVLKALAKLDLDTREIKEMQSEEYKKFKFYYIGIHEGSARKWAAKIEWELEIHPQSTICYLNLMNENLAKATMSNDDDSKHVTEDYWKDIYIKYVASVPPLVFYPRPIMNETDEKYYEESIFKTRDRLTLINDMISADVELGGAGIYVPSLREKTHPVADFFPLHEPEPLEYMLEQLFSWDPNTWLNLPLEEMRDYFGEYIAIYFAFLQFYTYFLIPATIVGIGFACYQYAEGTILVDGIAYFGLFIIVWCVFLPILWKRTEWFIALRWGQLRFDEQERPRPEFKGQYKKSAIDGSTEEYFPFFLRAQRMAVGYSVAFVFLIALFGSVAAIVLLRIYVADNNLSTYGDYVVSVANALVIMFFNNVYGWVAEKLNSWENYKTETEYENNLILKVFIFRFINSYASLYYIAFIRRYESGSLYCDAEGCMKNLRTQLAIIFLTQLFVSNSIELGELFVVRCFQGGTKVTSTSNMQERIWTEFQSVPYGRTFDDYNEIVVQFGYCTLFVIAWPFSPLAGFLSSIVESRIDGYKLCRLSRRPFPREGDDIGAWQIAIEIMIWAVVLTNLALICFVSNTLDIPFGISDEWFEEVLTSGFIFITLAVIVSILGYCLKTSPRVVSDHIHRENHIERALQEIGESTEVYINKIPEKDLTRWTEWTAREVLNYARETLFRNLEEYRRIEPIFLREKMDGKRFSQCTELELQEIGITDYTTCRLIVYIQKLLRKHLATATEQASMLEDIEAHDEEMSQKQGRDRFQTVGSSFQFTINHLPAMATYFEEDLVGTAKHKLWRTVDKDHSSVVEADELPKFLYLSMLVFIKGKYPEARLPKDNDPNLKVIINGLKQWLLQNKIGPNGLTYNEFDQYFPGWLREYQRYATESGIIASDVGGGYDPIPSQSEPVQSQIQAPIKSNPPLGIQSSQSIPSVELSSGKLVAIPREEWSQESSAWERKLDDIASIIESNDKSVRQKIWDKCDKDKTESLNSDKNLPRLLYGLILVYNKLKNKNAEAPSMDELKPLLDSVSIDIRSQLPGDNTNITKHDFVNHIASYISKVAKARRDHDATQLSDNFSIVANLPPSKGGKKPDDDKQKKGGLFGRK